MKILITFLTCLIPLSALAMDEESILRKASQIISHHRLLTRAELTCSMLVLDGASGTSATVTVREKHDKKCGGAPETAPRRFTMKIDLKTGAVQSDNNDDMEMRPIP